MSVVSGISGGGDPEVVGSHGDGSFEDGAQDPLARRYRRLLALLPKAYREARGEEVLGVLMDGAPEGRRWPAVREALSLAVLGVRVRSRALGAKPTMESARSLTRAVALTGSVWMTFASVTVGADDLRLWHRYGYHAPMGAGRHGLLSPIAATLLGFLWPVVLLALVRGWRMPARGLAAALATVAAISATDRYAFAGLVPEFVTVLAISLATPKDFAPLRRPRRLAPMLLALTAVGWYIVAGSTPEGSAADQLLGYSPFAAFCLAVLVQATWLARRSAVWPLAFAIVGTFLVGELVLTDLRFRGTWHDPQVEAAALFEGCLVLIAGYAVLRRVSKAAAAEAAGGAI